MQTIRRTFRVNESVVAAELDNETVLLNVESGIYFGLDEVGTMIWSLIAAGVDEEAIVERITAEYDVELDQVTHDVREFIGQLELKGIVSSGSD
jgi:hypothetical protein